MIFIASSHVRQKESSTFHMLIEGIDTTSSVGEVTHLKKKNYTIMKLIFY